MFGKRLSDEQLDNIRQYSKENKFIELDERKNILGKIVSINVIFYKSAVGTVHQDRFEDHANTSMSIQSREIAADITSRLYPSTDNDVNTVQEAYARE